MNELFPIMSGLVVGALLGFIRPAMRLGVGAFLALFFGVLATVISGEASMSWGFLLIDIPLVAILSFVGFTLARKLRFQFT